MPSAESKWVIVSGGTSPLGAALCAAIAAAGYHVFIHYYQQQAYAQELAHQCRAYGVEVETCYGDLSHEAGVLAFLTAYSACGIQAQHLINNASCYAVASLLDTPWELWHRLWQINLTAPLQLIQALADDLATNTGSIINLGVAGLERRSANSYNPAYMLTKNALWQATRSLAPQLIERQLRINMVSPGHLPHSVDLARFESRLPTRQPVALQAVADAVLFLLSPQAVAITGQNLEVAAGALM